MSWSPEHPISESDACSTGTGNCCRPFCRGGRSRAPFTAIPRASTISGSLVGAHLAGVRRAVAHNGNRDRCRGAQNTRYQSRTRVRQELGTAVAHSAGGADQGRRSPPSRALQRFRDRLSERTLRAFGVPLRTTETEIDVVEPRTPDIRVGRVFDRNWELLSPVLPVWMIKAAVHHHFARAISYLVYQNLSRLSTQWEESINGALWAVEKESRRRLDELMGTVERLVESSGN